MAAQPPYQRKQLTQPEERRAGEATSKSSRQRRVARQVPVRILGGLILVAGLALLIDPAALPAMS